MASNNATIAVIGLGYVGLPLAVEFGKKYRTIGFDIKQSKIDAYNRQVDPSGEVSHEALKTASEVGNLEFTADAQRLASADYLIVAVPTPVDNAHNPDFSPLVSASATVGRHMKWGATVIYESTVFPGATEEICIPVLEQHSGLKWMEGFHVGYSPERVNPGDKQRAMTTIVKVAAGDTPDTLERVAALYSAIINAGIHRASSIKVAEAAKVIENTQRDLNIALMNELSILFEKIGIDTTEVLEAAGTKWNFLKFKPGLVGGHCIGVDPYYLTHKAEMLGYHPQVILAGRRINDGMGSYVASKVVKLMLRKGINVVDSRILVLGLTFKEACTDLRNTRVIDIVRTLDDFNAAVDVFDPWIDRAEAAREYGITPLAALPQDVRYDAIVVAVAHPEFVALGASAIHRLGKENHVLYDVKSILPREESDARL